MDISSSLTLIFGLTYVGSTIYLANHEQITHERSTLVRWLLYGVVAVMFFYGLFILQLPFIPPSTDMEVPNVDAASAAVIFALTTALSLLAARIISSLTLRQRIRRILPASATFDPESAVHTTACVLLLAMIAVTFGDFVVSGGIAGLASNLESSGVNFGDFLFQNVLWLLAASLGIGLFIRRTFPSALARLGLRMPTLHDINWGIGVGVLLYGVVIAVGLAWALTVSPEQLQQQTAASEQLARSIDTLPLSLAISVVVAIGEEIFFRGALQPVFGIWLTSLFFAVIHTQYTLTPATLMIFVTSLALGWLRQRHSTSSAIVGHFVYNFIQLALAILAGTSL
jgi:membrane protease YdiL (CAAX protease family)